MWSRNILPTIFCTRLISPSIWRITISKGNHPIDRVSTHPFFFMSMFGFRSSTHMEVCPKNGATYIGHDVWIGRQRQMFLAISGSLRLMLWTYVEKLLSKISQSLRVMRQRLSVTIPGRCIWFLRRAARLFLFFPAGLTLINRRRVENLFPSCGKKISRIYRSWLFLMLLEACCRGIKALRPRAPFQGWGLLAGRLKPLKLSVWSAKTYLFFKMRALSSLVAT